MLHLNCDNCENQIKLNTKRYKSKIKPNYDICEKCIQEHNAEEFY